MIIKQEKDKGKPHYPWTARQRRLLKGRRLTRKQARKLNRNL